MKKLAYTSYGEFTDERFILTYGSDVIFDGYTDDLVTSVTGDLALQLNHGTRMTSSVIARRYHDLIVWIPTFPFDPDYVYQTIIFSTKQFAELWTFLNYNPDDDRRLINEITAEEWKRVWMVAARGTERVNDLVSLTKSVRNNIITLSAALEPHSPLLYDLIENPWVVKEEKPIGKTEPWKCCVAYLDKGTTEGWAALKKDSNNRLYLHVGSGFCLPI